MATVNYLYNDIRALHKGAGKEQKLLIFKIADASFIASDMEFINFLDNIKIIFEQDSKGVLDVTEIFNNIINSSDYRASLDIRGDRQIRYLENFSSVLGAYLFPLFSVSDVQDITDTLSEIRKDIAKEVLGIEEEILPPEIPGELDETQQSLSRPIIAEGVPIMPESDINRFVKIKSITEEQASIISEYNNDALYKEEDIPSVRLTLRSLMTLYKDLNLAINVGNNFVIGRKTKNIEDKISDIQDLIRKATSTSKIVVDHTIPGEEKQPDVEEPQDLPGTEPLSEKDLEDAYKKVEELEKKNIPVRPDVPKDVPKDVIVDVLPLSQKSTSQEEEEEEDEEGEIDIGVGKKRKDKSEQIKSSILISSDLEQAEKDIQKEIAELSLISGMSAATKYINFDLEKGTISLDADGIIQLFSFYKSEFDSCISATRMQMRQRIQSPEPLRDIKIRFNTICHKVKIFDAYLYNTYQNIKTIVLNAINNLSTDDLLYRRMVLLKNQVILFEKDVINQFMSNYILSLNVESFYNELIFLSKADSGTGDKSYQNYILPDKNKDIGEYQGPGSATLEFEFGNIVRSSFISKFTKYFDPNRLNIQSVNAYPYNNIISFLNREINIRIVISQAKKKVADAKFASTKIIKCGACNKLIPFYTSKVSRTRKERNENIISLITVPIFSIMRKDGSILSSEDLSFDKDGREAVYMITEEFIQKYYLSKTKTDSMRITIEFIRENILSDAKPLTWSEILSLLNSSNNMEYITGLIMKAVAFDKIADDNIKSFSMRTLSLFKSLCPFSYSLGIEGDISCGISLDIPAGATNAYNMQPVFNGVSPERVPAKSGYSYVYSKPELNIENPSLIKEIAAKSNPGFKFSNLTINCPTYLHINKEEVFDIKNVMISSNVISNQDKIAIRIAGQAAGLPIGDALPDNISEQYAYHVCSAETSISCVDRDPNSPTYFITYVKSLFETNKNAYANLVYFLVDNGFDDLELMEMLSDNIIIKSASLEKRDERLRKIEQILSKHAANISEDVYSVIKGVTLVCPHRHKFTIEQGMSFGNCHTYISERNQGKLNQVLSRLATAKSKGNPEEDISFLRREGIITPLSSLTFLLQNKYVYYDEWISLSPDIRRISIDKVRQENIGRFYYLKVNLNGIDYAFSSSGTSIKLGDIYNEMYSFQKERNYDSSIYTLDAGITGSFSLDTNSGKIGGGPDDSGPGQQISYDDKKSYSDENYESYTRWDKILNNILDEDMPARFIIPGTEGFVSNIVIPERKERAADLVGTHLRKTLKAVIAILEIIENWRSRILDVNFSLFLTPQKDVGSATAPAQIYENEIENIASIIFGRFLSKNIILKDEEDNDLNISDIPYEDLKKVYKPYIDLYNGILINNIKIKNLINLRYSEESSDKKLDDIKLNLVRDIITESLFEFSAKFMSVETPSEFRIDITEELSVDTDDIYFNSENIVNIANEILDLYKQKTELYDQFLTLSIQKTYIASYDYGKLSIISYINYMVYTLKRLGLLFLNESSANDINVSIFNDFINDEDKIFNITKEQIKALNEKVETMPVFGFGSLLGKIEDFNSYYKDPQAEYEIGSARSFREDSVRKYLSLLAKAYQMLELYIEYGPTLISQPKVIDDTLNMVKNKISEDITVFVTSPKSKKVAPVSVKLGGVLDLSCIPYKDAVTNDPDEQEGKLYVASTLPLLSTSSKGNEFWDDFYSTLKVNSDGTGLENSEYNFRTNELQIGAIRSRVEGALQWPPPTYGYALTDTNEGYIGIYVPITDILPKKPRPTHLSITKAKVVVKIPMTLQDSSGQNVDEVLHVDIGFLFSRKMTSDNLDKIHFSVSEYKTLQKWFNNLPPEKKKMQKVINYCNDYISSLRRMINSFPYRISYGRGQDLSGSDFLNIDLYKFEKDSLLINEGRNKGLTPEQYSKIASSIGGADIRAFMSIVDPILAFHLINNPGLHGTPLINLGEKSYREDVIKAALIKFICDVYNIQSISDYFCSPKDINIDYERAYSTREPLPAEIFLRETASGRLTNIIKKVKKFRNNFTYENSINSNNAIRHGQWFSVDVDQTEIIWNAASNEDGTLKLNSRSLELEMDKVNKAGVITPLYDKKKKNQLDRATIPYRAYDAIRRFLRKRVTDIEDIDPFILEKESKNNNFTLLKKSLSGVKKSSRMYSEDYRMIDIDAILENR